MLSPFLDLLYPPTCLGCRARADGPGVPLCPTCLQRMERAPVLGVAAELDRLPFERGALDGAAALWMFDKGGTLQRVQHALKYGDRPRYGWTLGQLLATAVREAFADETDAIAGTVPIPLHRTRELERGYNQSLPLAEGVADVLNIPVRADLLARPTLTRTQTRLTRKARWQNVRDAFAAAPEANGGTWLLVDDVMTTGSTATAAAAQLKQAGATAVYLAALAVAKR